MSNWDRNTPWRQGNLIDLDAAKRLGIEHNAFPEATAPVVISHDCDLAQSAANEPFVEVIVGRFVSAADGNFTHAKNLRKLHLPYVDGNREVFVELVAVDKKLVPKEGDGALAGNQPAAIRLSPQARSVLQLWLAARYRRAAFPDEFDRRLGDTRLREQLSKILKPLGVHIPAIFFDVDEGEEVARQGADDTYSLTITLLYSTDVEPEKAESDAMAAKKAIEDAFKRKCCNEGVWQWIELRDCEVIADTALTYAQSCIFKKWQADHISLKSDPPQAVKED
ncbi:MAG: hypothetical protein ACREX0_04935 [Noviherbaspirillum sp.]